MEKLNPLEKFCVNSCTWAYPRLCIYAYSLSSISLPKLVTTVLKVCYNSKNKMVQGSSTMQYINQVHQHINSANPRLTKSSNDPNIHGFQIDLIKRNCILFSFKVLLIFWFDCLSFSIYDGIDFIWFRLEFWNWDKFWGLNCIMQ